MAATNMKQLEKMLMKQMNRAMKEVSKNVEAVMTEEVADFYSGEKPTMYVRTGQLGRTPKVSGLSTHGKTISMEAYLDESGGYTTGKKPSMTAVLDVANDHSNAGAYGLRPPVGKEGFWNRSKENIESTFYETMGRFFP